MSNFPRLDETGLTYLVNKLAEKIRPNKNVQSDWNESDSTSDAYIKNKPSVVTNVYSPNDSASTTINDTDYIPISENNGTTKKKALWSTIVAKVKTAFGIESSGSTFLKKDGTWGTPTNTTYTFATGDSNGQIKVTPSGGTAQNVSVKGLGSNAYSSTSYLPLAGGTVTGTLILSNTTDAAGTSDTNSALKIGNVTGQHLEFDTNELMSKASATTTGPLYLNNDGGDVYINQKLAARHTATPTSGQVVITDGTTGGIKSSGYTIAKSVPSDAKFTDTIYESKAAASGGTAVSLCTTGEKYTWNNVNKAYKNDDAVETTIADDDYIPFYDTSASAKKKTLWSNIVTKLKNIFPLGSTLAPIANGPKYPGNWSAGKKFIYQGQLCKTKVNVTTSDNISIGSSGNAELDSDITSQISGLNTNIGTLSTNVGNIFNLYDFPKSTKLISNVNLNGYIGNDVWRLNGNITNGPGLINYGILIVISPAGSMVRQILLPDGENNIYTRRLYSNVWSTWGIIKATDVNT